jgi:hypothetical protein
VLAYGSVVVVHRMTSRRTTPRRHSSTSFFWEEWCCGGGGGSVVCMQGSSLSGRAMEAKGGSLKLHDDREAFRFGLPAACGKLPYPPVGELNTF